MSSLNARRGDSSNVPSEDLDIVLSLNIPTAPLIPTSSPTFALRITDDWYDDFNGDGGPSFTSHGRKVHSDISSVTIPVREITLSEICFSLF